MNWTPIIGIALWALIPGFIAKHKNRSFWAYYFLSFLITPLFTMIITLCLSKLNPLGIPEEDTISSTPDKEIELTGQSTLRQPIQQEELPLPIQQKERSEQAATQISTDLPPQRKQLSSNNVTTKGKQDYSKIRFCRRCGFELIENSEFCSRCGTEIEKEDHR